MPFKEHTYSVLIVCASEKLTNSLMDTLPEKKYAPIRVVKSISEAQRDVLERSYDLIIINTPLPDDFGRKFSIDIFAHKVSVPLLLVRSELYAETYDKVVDYGVLTLRKPTSASVISQSLDFMCAIRERLRKMEKKAVSLEDKMAEIRIVNRAKWVLIEHCSMAETDAHHYIEKQAMDRCVSKREVAESIIKTYS